MPDTSDKKEKREPRAQQESAQERQSLLEKHFEEGAQDIVQEARQDVAVTHLPWYRSIKRAYYLLGIDVLLLVLFALLATFVHFHPVVGIDVTITREFQENQSPWLQGLMTALSYIGYHAWLSIGLVVLAVLIFRIVDLRLEAITLAAVYAVSGILTALMKIVVGRPRPSAGLVEVFRTLNDQSFPSGHVMSYVAFWGMLFIFGIILFDGRRWWRIGLLVISAFFVVLIGPSRIYLGAHWATDVLGAYLIEVALLGIALLVYLQLNKRGVLAMHKEHSWLSSRKVARSKGHRPAQP